MATGVYFHKTHALSDLNCSLSHTLTGQKIISQIFPKNIDILSFIDQVFSGWKAAKIQDTLLFLDYFDDG